MSKSKHTYIIRLDR